METLQYPEFYCAYFDSCTLVLLLPSKSMLFNLVTCHTHMCQAFNDKTAIFKNKYEDYTYLLTVSVKLLPYLLGILTVIDVGIGF